MICPICKRTFRPYSKIHRCCCEKCQVIYWRQRNRDRLRERHRIRSRLPEIRARNRKYKLTWIRPRDRKEHNCRICGTIIDFIKGQHRKLYCSDCKSPSSKERFPSTCDNCGIRFLKSIRSETNLCSLKCIGNHLYRNWRIFTCEYCGKEKQVTASYPSAKRFCSNECAHKAIPFPMNRGLSKYQNQDQKYEAKQRHHRTWYVKARDELHDSYIRSILVKRLGLSQKDFPSEIVEIKRKHITALRLIRKKQTKCT